MQDVQGVLMALQETTLGLRTPRAVPVLEKEGEKKGKKKEVETGTCNTHEQF